MPPTPCAHPLQPDGLRHGVIVGCRRADGRWLLIRRALALPLAPGKICFPGGAIELGEDRAGAAAREFEEELGVQVTDLAPVWSHTFGPPRDLRLWGFYGKLTGESLKPNSDEVAEVLWLTAKEAAEHPDGLPMTGAFVAALESSVAK